MDLPGDQLNHPEVDPAGADFASGAEDTPETLGVVEYAAAAADITQGLEAIRRSAEVAQPPVHSDAAVARVFRLRPPTSIDAIDDNHLGKAA